MIVFIYILKAIVCLFSEIFFINPQGMCGVALRVNYVYGCRESIELKVWLQPVKEQPKSLQFYATSL